MATHWDSNRSRFYTRTTALIALALLLAFLALVMLPRTQEAKAAGSCTASPNTGNGVHTTTSTDQPVFTHHGADRYIRVSVPDGPGGGHLEGCITRAKRLTHNRKGHILSSGTLNQSGNPNAGGTHPCGYALAVSSSTACAEASPRAPPL